MKYNHFLSLRDLEMCIQTCIKKPFTVVEQNEGVSGIIKMKNWATSHI